MSGNIQNIRTWNNAYKEREDLAQFGSAGLALFAMALKFGYDDLVTIGADAVVDGPDDKGCDAVYVDFDLRIAIIAQSYYAERLNAQARDGKAATLRQAASWLLEVEIGQVPDRLKASAELLRSAVQDGSIDRVYVWFVHNCPSSINVSREMKAIQQTVNAILSSQYKEKSISVIGEEISTDNLEKLYTDTSTPILVTDNIIFNSVPGLFFEEEDWKYLVIPISVKKLRDLYKKYNTNLFSANVRDFLGVKAGDSNINYQMQKTLEESPNNFFIYNNGLTILTHKIEQIREGDGKTKVIVSGISIVNGAQTTGTIGTSDNEPSDDSYVLARFISTNNEDLISDVVRYNNSQNAVTASDFRSTDPIQRRLVGEMKAIPDAEYDGGRRGGISAAIKRRPKLLPSYSVGQALASLHGAPTIAYNEKSAIWSRDVLYSRFFNDQLTAKHIVFAYALLRCVENEKNDLRTKEESGGELTRAEKEKLVFYRKRGSVFLLVAAVGECLETIIDKPIPNKFLLRFGERISPEQAVQLWKPTVEALSGLHIHLDKALTDGLKNQERISDNLKAFSQLVATLKGPYASFFESIKDNIKIN
ncbi:hypothetical protein ASN_2921 [Acetobacter senegalensis]|uniref:Abortive phage infection protein C-terminal domain-containing protein n=1 Tax=Acetobacter senegalensis TaxID=446692 RepID=A0A0U5EXA2_9PROT|nr:AIPR family protein [Acetobacter senegalensis]CEF42175.1 hypothetical protein ASN_2921 [Acetobacter senegalensis]